MLDENRVVAMLWIGPCLSKMERLSIKSFQANGHTVNLYVYAPVANVPDGTVICDGNDIVPESRIKDFRYLAQFSNLFVYKLLLDKGGWFSDCDNVCLRPIDFIEPYVFYRNIEETTVTAAICKCPKGSALMQYLYDYVNNLTPKQLAVAEYQSLGPDLTRQVILGPPNPTYGLPSVYGRPPAENPFAYLRNYLKPGHVTDPISWSRIQDLIVPKAKWPVLQHAYTLHLFAGAWEGMSGHESLPAYLKLGTKDDKYPDGCLYENLKAQYGC